MDPETKTDEKREERLAQKRVRERMRQADKLLKEAGELQEGERMCRGRKKLRDENGEYLRGPDGEVLTRPCKAHAIKGGFVCWHHGGKAPQVRAKAQKRMLALVEPSIIRLGALIAQDDHKPTALGAIRTVLERAEQPIGALIKETGEKDTRPIINIGIKVGGIDHTPEVKVGLLPTIDAAVTEGDGTE
jgi:hypothetical protein